MPDMISAHRGVEAGVTLTDGDTASADGEAFRETSQARDGSYVIELQYRGKEVPDQTSQDACRVTGPPQAIARVSLDRIARPVFEKPLFGAFDAILLAAGDGTVLLQSQARDETMQHVALARLSSSDRDDAAAPSVIVTRLANLNERVSWKNDGRFDLARLGSATHGADIELSGQRYLLLGQPYVFEVPRLNDKASQWIVCGLIAKERFRREATEISPSLIALSVGILILLACCWPFMKLAFSGVEEPITRGDVVMLAVATLVGAGVLTLLCVDVIAYTGMKSIADYQQRAYAADITRDIREPLSRIVVAATALQEWSEYTHLNSDPVPRQSIDNVGQEFLNHSYPGVMRYTQYSSFAWVDTHGQQVVRGSMLPGRPPLLDVSKRPYFHALYDQTSGIASLHPWLWRDNEGVHKLVIDSVRTLTNGSPEAVIAFPTRHRELPVFTVTMPFIHLVERLALPGMSFAVIDDSGGVLFHSDAERNGIENIFTETDNNRDLRAAVVAHNSRFVDARYWGEDVRIFVSPMSDLPWTLLTIRSRRLLRTANLETIVISLTLYLLYISIVAVLLVAITVSKPEYRARWIWPDETRAARWFSIKRMLVAMLIVFCVCTYAYEPSDRVGLTVALPLLVFSAFYLTLRRGPKRILFGVALCSWLLLTFSVFGALAMGHMNGEVVASRGYEFLVRTICLLATVAGSLCVARATPQKEVTRRSFIRSYIVCGMLVVIVGAMLPMVALFTIAHSVEREALVKYGQLRLADSLLKRLDTLAARSWAPTAGASTSYDMPFFFESTWCIQGGVDQTNTPVPCGAGSTLRSSFRPTRPFDVVRNEAGEWIEGLLPQYSEDSTAMRGLHHERAADGTWFTLRSGRMLALFRWFDITARTSAKLAEQARQDASYHAYQAVVAAIAGKSAKPTDEENGRALHIVNTIRAGEALAGDDAVYAPLAKKEIDGGAAEASRFTDNNQKQWLVVVSRMPVVFGEWLRAADPLPLRTADYVVVPALGVDRPLPPSIRMLFLLASAISMLALLWLAIRFISRRVFLLDIREPQWFSEGPLQPPLGEHLFYVAGEDTITILEERNSFRVVDLSTFKQPDRHLQTLSEIEAGRHQFILCAELASNMSDRELTRQKLEFLEAAVRLSGRTVVVVSSLSPTLVLNACRYADEQTRHRWETILGAFLWIDDDQLFARLPAKDDDGGGLRWKGWLAVIAWAKQFTPKGREQADEEDERMWLSQESAANPFLAKVAGLVGVDIDEFRERAERFYERLWTRCTPGERLMLMHVARYGFAHANDRRILRRLLARRLLARDPELRLFNDTFRLFVVGRAGEVEAECQKESRPATVWDQLRIPLFIAVLVSGVVLIGTQKELATATSAILTALATGLPAIVKLTGVFTDRRVRDN